MVDEVVGFISVFYVFILGGLGVGLYFYGKIWE